MEEDMKDMKNYKLNYILNYSTTMYTNEDEYRVDLLVSEYHVALGFWKYILLIYLIFQLEIWV